MYHASHGSAHTASIEHLFGEEQDGYTSDQESRLAERMREGVTDAEAVPTEGTKEEETERDRKARLLAISQQNTELAMQILFHAQNPARAWLVNVALYNQQSAVARFDWESKQCEKTAKVIAIIGKHEYEKLEKRVLSRTRRDKERNWQRKPSRPSRDRSKNWGSDTALEEAIKNEMDSEKRKALRRRLVDRRRPGDGRAKKASCDNGSEDA
ncbi:hypothetical protein QFC24_003868 [Naganishia onofrii]|uniref:Uncharacterized protein n=1 Tax=Naganishia onofrii TaxID=1851511 RepID=A0ACC2XHT9_9TREE|nr:hypothetical protein QFC24_003868 [Naganishia onofrii]